ncbi:MAG: D-aminoacyl-tRNA deacylase [Planctomycetota bacterium]|nr:D-aminoacyl-tRNA deacylase [Planctomycetota bacterium]
MKLVVQRVLRGEVRVEGAVVGRVGMGMVVLLGVLEGDGMAEVERLADKLARFRFFEDPAGRMNLAAIDVGAGALVVSQFTLAADGRKGRRPSFDLAAPPGEAEPLYEAFCARLASHGIPVETGRFGAAMEVELVGSGPVTFVLEETPA